MTLGELRTALAKIPSDFPGTALVIVCDDAGYHRVVTSIDFDKDKQECIWIWAADSD
jgi:hypothetical protein